jgi:hypothetical protein
MDNHTAAYHYRPIVSNDEIRVLRLDPGNFNDPLAASISHERSNLIWTHLALITMASLTVGVLLRTSGS